MERPRIVHACPRCGAPLRREHRLRRDRLLGLFWPSKRFRCPEEACGWMGLQPSREMRRQRDEAVAQALGAAGTTPAIVFAILLILALSLLYWSLSRP
jgi:hypothetical protein